MNMETQEQKAESIAKEIVESAVTKMLTITLNDFAKAIETIDRNGHRFELRRKCESCEEVSKLIKYDFGCVKIRKAHGY